MTARKNFGSHQIAGHLGAPGWQVDRARDLGLLPEPDAGGNRWSAAAVAGIGDRWPQILAAVEAARELGAVRCAELLAGRAGLAVDAADVEELAARGLVQVSGYFKDRPLYRVAEIEALAASPGRAGVLAGIVADRQAWLAASLNRHQAAARLGWPTRELEQAVGRRGVRPGRFGRYPAADIDALAADKELAEEIRKNRLLGPGQAAGHLKIRRTDFDYCVAADWIAPAGYADSHVSHRRTVSVPLYRTGDVEAVLEIPGVDWEAVRAARPGQRSPLREFARLLAGRAALVRGFAAALAERYGLLPTEVAARYDDRRDRWELTWIPDASGQPDKKTVRAALRADRALAPHAPGISLHAAGAEPPGPGL